MVASGDCAPCPALRALLVKKSSKSQSGVLARGVLRAQAFHAPQTLRDG
jgi:hypothetical protein